MRGKNHMIVNTATLAGASTLFYDMAYGFGTEHLTVSRIGNLALWYMTDTAGMEPAWLYYPVSVIFFLAGSLLPDVDNQFSPAGQRLYIPVKHRTITHSLWFVLVCLIPGLFLFKPMVWLALGCFLHIFYDAFSISGVHWLYPIKNKHHVFKIYKTGELTETLFAVIVVGVCVALSVLALIRIFT